MKIEIKIDVFGSTSKLITLSRLEEVPSGIYSSSPVNTSINLTDSKKVFTRLCVDYQDLNGEKVTHMKSREGLNVFDLLTDNSIEEFDELISQMKINGWSVTRYENSVNDFFIIDDSAFDNTIKSNAIMMTRLMLFIAIVITPAMSVWLYINQIIISPIEIGLSYLSVLSILYYLSIRAWDRKSSKVDILNTVPR